ncbi:hypothetical protein [Fodinicola acaciae]|uniref:hypothetical protein n=1 Tax=Fodinicola acaciae TaxID=2681555 RepID=UPI0013CF8F83|nr:hypothetical protein [Fodinicola acaciae]
MASALGDVLLWSLGRLLPHGGQRTARRNAWIAMSEGVARARQRQEAETALTLLPADARRKLI